MMTEQEIRNWIAAIEEEDDNCPTDACKNHRSCADFGHPLRGTILHVLHDILGDMPADKSYLLDQYGHRYKQLEA